MTTTVEAVSWKGGKEGRRWTEVGRSEETGHASFRAGTTGQGKGTKTSPPAPTSSSITTHHGPLQGWFYRGGNRFREPSMLVLAAWGCGPGVHTGLCSCPLPIPYAWGYPEAPILHFILLSSQILGTDPSFGGLPGSQGRKEAHIGSPQPDMDWPSLPQPSPKGGAKLRFGNFLPVMTVYKMENCFNGGVSGRPVTRGVPVYVWGEHPQAAQLLCEVEPSPCVPLPASGFPWV